MCGVHLKQYWVKYKYPFTRQNLEEDDHWRNNMLGHEHWCGKSYTSFDVEVCVVVNEEQAFLISLKYPTKVKEYVALVS